MQRAAVGSLSIAVVALAGCGGDDARSAGDAATPAAVSAARVTPRSLPETPQIGRAVGALADVRRDACPTTPGRVRAAGRVRNPTSTPVDYAITVHWVTADGDVRDRAVTTVRRVEPGRSARWTATTTLRATNAAQCSYFVQRGTLADTPKGTQ
jgi:hypothetical protein